MRYSWRDVSNQLKVMPLRCYNDEVHDLLLRDYFFVTDGLGKISGIANAEAVNGMNGSYTFKKTQSNAPCPLCADGEERGEGFLVKKVKEFREKFGKTN